MRPQRLSSKQLASHLAGVPREMRAIALRVRKIVLARAPTATEAIKFRCLCYYRGDAPFGSIGGNICMIELSDRAVALSFVHGADLPDPHHLLRGRGKVKRFVSIASLAAVRDGHLLALIHAAVERSGDSFS